MLLGLNLELVGFGISMVSKYFICQEFRNGKVKQQSKQSLA